MEVQEFAKQLFFGESLNDKEFICSDISFANDSLLSSLPQSPARHKKIKMTHKNIKFPRGHFHLDDKKAIALHSFANHELLAIEMMAAALLIYPHNTKELIQFKKGIIGTIKDEQKHFRLYVDRLNDLGYEFGDFDLNDYFWNQMKEMKTPSQYMSVMALTFEAANLDFAYFYKEEFLKVDDSKTANILDVVLKDEISHVALGVSYLNRWKNDKSLQEYYLENLPGNLTPARSKGKIFLNHLRKQAKMSDDFIDWVRNYQDDFVVTHRKEWKK